MFKDEICTRSGKMVPLVGDPSRIVFDFADIAGALSKICRFNGHCKEFYSVAQHCVLVSYLCDPKYKLAGLMHDASEAYLGDVVTPLKQLLGQYGTMERIMQHAIYSNFNIKISIAGRHFVKRMYRIALATEQRDLMPNSGKPWLDPEVYPPMYEVINPLGPKVAEQLFTDTFVKLCPLADLWRHTG